MVQIISSGSKGNAVLYHQSILVDIGVPFARIKPFLKSIQLVLLTHVHMDHIYMSTLTKLVKERPTIRIGCCEWMADLVKGLKNVDVFDIGQTYNYGAVKISPLRLYHDVPNCGYRIFKDDTKIIHCTDTAHLEGIEAPNYDLYAIEHNYNEETIHENIAALEARGKFPYMKGSLNSHLSEQQARDFFFRNKGEHSQLIRLHETSFEL